MINEEVSICGKKFKVFAIKKISIKLCKNNPKGKEFNVE
jgi:hypothetical protein